MEKLPSKVVRLDGGQTVAEVLEQSVKLSHNWAEVIVLAVAKDGSSTMRRTRLSIADQCLLLKVLDTNVNGRMISTLEEP